MFLRSGLFAAGYVSLTVAFATLGLLSAPLPYRARYKVITPWTQAVLAWLRITCGLRHEIEGLDNIPKNPAVILCKHQSAWETIALEPVFRPQCWLLKRELLWIPFFGWALALLKPIAIDRRAQRSALTRLVEHGAQRLRDGIWVVVFPEGTRMPPGVRGKYRKGGATLAVQTGHPVLPIAHNAGDFWPKRSMLKFPGVIRLVIGKPIETAGRSAEDVNTEAAQWIEHTVAKLRAGDAD
ncbi:MAG: 1-acyl-sn-glycerol-3-phosphate acyltransferase [Gammaproteobacteria bacterium]|nr:1-acyl-sn-glycerol-3-phosphate acyltransferase [Gammaproteobacteria bacterium]